MSRLFRNVYPQRAIWIGSIATLLYAHSTLLAQTPAEMLPSSSQAAPVELQEAPQPQIGFEVIKELLPNGLTLLMNPDHRVPTVAVEVRYLVGSGHERVGRSGFAHLFEHLMFQGSQSYDHEYFTPFTPLGGKVNGTTNVDRTNYYEQIPANALELALWMESDRMEGLLGALTQEKLDNQRDVVKNERRQRYENTPYGMVWKLFSNHIFPEGHPYQHTTIGSHEDLSAATLEDVRAFFKQYYVPANAVITLVGDFDPREASAMVHRYFGHLPSGERAKRPTAPPIPQAGERVITLRDQVKLPRVYLAWPTPALYARGDAEMDLLASLLTSGKSSALYRPLVFEQQIAKDVFAFQVSMALGSYFVVGATAAPDHSLEELNRALREELRQALSQPAEEAEFQRALNAWRKSFYSSAESVLDRAQQMSTYEHLLGEPNSFAFDLSRYTSLTPAIVAQRAQEALGGSPLTIRVVPADSVAPPPERDELPALAQEPQWSPPSVDTFTIQNGLEVWLVQQTQSPLLSMELIFDGGASADPADKAGLISLMATLLDEGAGDRDAIQVSDALKQLATDYHAGVSTDHVNLSMDLLSENLAASLDLFADFLMRPRLSEADFERMRKQTIASVIAQSSDPRNTRNVVLKRVLFGDGYAGLPAQGFPQTLQSITLEDVKSAYQAQIRPQGATLVVVGNLDRARLESELNRALNGWRGAPTVQPRPLKVQPQVAGLHWIDFPGSTQSAVALVRVSEGLSDDPRQMDEELFNLVFGGQFTSRLNLNLREDKGYTYGAYSGLYRLKRAGFHFLGAMVKGDTTLASVQEMFRELNEITAQRPVQAKELEDARGGEVKGYPARFEERGKILGELTSAREENRDPTWLVTWLNQVKDAHLPSVQRAADRVARPEAYHVVIAGDRGAYLEPFKALALPIKIYSPEGELIEMVKLNDSSTTAPSTTVDELKAQEGLKP